MKKFILFFAASLIYSTTAFAGGPDVKTPPQVNLLPPIGLASKQEVIQPIAKLPAIKSKMPPKVDMPAQPSDTRIDKVAEAAPATQAMVMKPPEVKKVTVLFESEPTSAELMVNGLYVGSTPIQVPLRKGVHNIKYVRSGHAQWERQVIVYQGLRVFGILDKEK